MCVLLIVPPKYWNAWKYDLLMKFTSSKKEKNVKNLRKMLKIKCGNLRGLTPVQCFFD